jgi:hypothetical protein
VILAASTPGGRLHVDQGYPEPPAYRLEGKRAIMREVALTYWRGSRFEKTNRRSNSR